MSRSARASHIGCILLVLSSVLAAQNRNGKENTLPVDEPRAESIDLDRYQQNRDEGFRHPHIMEYASALSDGIGPASPAHST
jgi:hypothetical protein